MIGLDFGFGPLELLFWRWLFVMTRIGAALVAVPMFGGAAVPPQVRVILAGALSVFVCGWTTVVAPPALLSLPGLVTIAGEVVIGLALGFVLQMTFATPVIAAEVIGAGMGMSIAAAIDPATGAHSPALGQYFNVVLTIIFLGIGGHLDWIALLLDSYRAFPPGVPWMSAARLGMIDGYAAQMFLTALTMALPISILLLVVQIVTGIIGRSAPALNLLALGLPAGVLAGIGALLASAPLLGDTLTDLARAGLSQTAALLVK